MGKEMNRERKKYGGRISKAVCDFVYPGSLYCIGCGALIDRSRHYSLCNSCLSKFHFASGRTCEKCGKILEEGYHKSICRDCTVHEKKFERGYSCMLYGLYEKKILRDFKYSGKSYYAPYLGELMYDRVAHLLENEIGADIVVPVPLHRKKQNKRGYNQAELLAREISKRSGIPMKKVLVRTKNTRPMSSLTGAERRENLTGVFAVRPRQSSEIANNRILLIDDIYTTGSTANACSETLKSAGASAVIVLCLAAGGNGGSEDYLKN